MKNYTDVTLVQQTSRMLANSVKVAADAKGRQVFSFFLVVCRSNAIVCSLIIFRTLHGL
jgi:hypothetical protein